MIRSYLSNAAWCLLAGLLMAGCQPSCAQEPATVPSSAARTDSTTLEPPYTLAEPDTVFPLPIDLLEISGLTLLDAGHLGAIQDEEGDLYVIDVASGQVVRRERFAGKGDYEGVERINDGRVIVLRSDGTLFAIEGWTDGTYSSNVDRLETVLHTKCDAEGLGYDRQANHLLIACKDFAGKGLEGQKAIYAYDLASSEFLRDPAYVLTIDAFEQAYPDNPLDNTLREFLEPAWDLSGFTPSALAIHPITEHLYILSSERKALVILDRDGGTLLNVWILPDEIFEQPEGLAFLPNGDLFISSEGRSDHAVLARYSFHQP